MRDCRAEMEHPPAMDWQTKCKAPWSLGRGDNIVIQAGPAQKFLILQPCHPTIAVVSPNRYER